VIQKKIPDQQEVKMPHRNSPEERQIEKLLAQSPAKPEDRSRWAAAVAEQGFTEELAEEIRTAFQGAVESETESEAIKRTRFNMEFNRLVQRWRLVNQSKNFSRR
jgi:hypothetical protein